MSKEKTAKMTSEVYEGLVKSSQSLIAILGFDGEIKEISKGFIDVMGYTKPELLSKPFMALIHPEDASAALGELKRAEKGGITRKSETRFVNIAGEIIWTTWNITADIDVGLMCFVASDVSDLKEAFQLSTKLRMEQYYYLNSLPDGVWYKDDKNNLIKINQAAADMIGKPIAEIEGRNLSEFMPNEAEAFLKLDQEVLKSGKPRYNHVQSHVTKDGYKFWSKTHSIPYIDSETGNGFLLIMTIDITELKETEERLKKSQRLYRILARQTPNFAVIIFDNSFKFLLAEGTALAASGYSPEGMEGNTIYDVLPKDTLEILLPYYQGTIEGKSYNFQHTYEKRYYYVQMVPVRISEGDEIEGGMIIVNETTEIKKAEQELIFLNKTLEQRVLERTNELEISNIKLTRINTYLDDFVYAAAHDLKAPIINIQQYIELLNKVDESKKEEIINSMAKNAKSLNNVLTSLVEIIEYQQIDDSKVEILDFNYVLEDAIEKCKLRLEESKSKISNNFNKAPTITYVSVYLRSVMYNLISNSAKYCREGVESKIDINTRNNEEYVVLSVEDNGIGIDMEKYGHLIFKPFKQLMPETPGDGIGLNIVKNIVEKNGGYIKVDSKLGQGSKFSIYLKPYSKN